MDEEMRKLVEDGKMSEEAYRQLGETLVKCYRRPSSETGKLELAQQVISDLWRVWNSESDDWYDIGKELFKRGLAEDIGVQEPEPNEDEPDEDEPDELRAEL